MSIYACTQHNISTAEASTRQRQRLVGSLILQVSFAKEPYERNYILQKRPMILRDLWFWPLPRQRQRADSLHIYSHVSISYMYFHTRTVLAHTHTRSLPIPPLTHRKKKTRRIWNSCWSKPKTCWTNEKRRYEVPTISRLLKVIGLFCRI